MRQNIRIRKYVWLIAVFFALATVPSSHAQFFNNRSMQGTFVFSFDGSFSSALPPFFTGPMEKVGFSQVGLFHFGGDGQVTAEYSFVLQATSLGGAFQQTAVGTYSIDVNGRMVIQTEDFIGDFKGNALTYDCVIVEANQLARCHQTEVISFQQGPDPVVLPTSALGKIERRK